MYPTFEIVSFVTEQGYYQLYVYVHEMWRLRLSNIKYYILISTIINFLTNTD